MRIFAMKSRVNREVHARICEGLGVKFPGATRPPRVRQLHANWRFPIGVTYVAGVAGMIDRAMLHQLIDSAPDESLVNVERVLQYEGYARSGVGRISEATAAKWRRELHEGENTPDDWNSLREKMRRGIQRRVRRMEVNGMGNAALRQPDGSTSSSQGIDKDGALIVLTFRYFKGHKIETAERISFSAEDQSLMYSQDVTGPDGGHAYQSAQFSAGE